MRTRSESRSHIIQSPTRYRRSSNPPTARSAEDAASRPGQRDRFQGAISANSAGGSNTRATLAELVADDLAGPPVRVEAHDRRACELRRVRLGGLSFVAMLRGSITSSAHQGTNQVASVSASARFIEV